MSEVLHAQVQGSSKDQIWYRPLAVEFILPVNDVRALTSALFHAKLGYCWDEALDTSQDSAFEQARAVLAEALKKRVSHPLTQWVLIIVAVERDFASGVYRIEAASRRIDNNGVLHQHRYQITIKTEVPGVDMGERTPL